MIYDSGIWKVELHKNAKVFMKLLTDTDFNNEFFSKEDESGETNSYLLFIEFQKFCFYSAVISRKLFESERLSDELKRINISVKSFKRKSSKELTKNNFDGLDNEYDLENPSNENLSLEKICHLFIHSFIFNPKIKERKADQSLPDEDIENWLIEGLEGLYINTDHIKNLKIYYFQMDQIFKVFQEIYEDDVVYISENRVTGKTIRSKINNRP